MSIRLPCASLTVAAIIRCNHFPPGEQFYTILFSLFVLRPDLPTISRGYSRSDQCIRQKGAAERRSSDIRERCRSSGEMAQ